MDLTNLTRLVAASSLIAAAACGAEQATPADMAVTPPAQTASTSGPAQSSTPAATAPTAAPATPAVEAPKPATPAPTAPAPATPMPADMMPAAMTPAAMPGAPAEPTEPVEPAGKQYTFDEIMMLPQEELEAAWGAAPAEEIWTGCSGEFAELRHSASGAPMDTTPPTWGGKCIPPDTKILYNIIGGSRGSPASGPAELIPSFIDDKPAVVVTYSGGTTLHFRHMGEALWVGRQAMGMNPSGTWYPLGDIKPE
jgi:hypothetical protein